MGINCLMLASVFVCFFATVIALKCYQCGQYNDGVGSITPCINESYSVLKECPSPQHNFCIKYISEGSTVRDCVPKCTEREDWGTRTFCCIEDGCNSAFTTQPSVMMAVTMCSFVVVAAMVLLH